jgi:mono/diheme cytochrome c family protein
MVNNLNRILISASMFVFYSGSPESILKKGLEMSSQIQIQETPQAPSKPEEGEGLYIKYCLSCHQKDGSGVPNMYPPIHKSDWVNGDKNKLIKVLLNGLEGDIEVNGDPYNQVMPKQNYLTDLQIARVLTYIRQNFGNNAGVVKPGDVTDLREQKK